MSKIQNKSQYDLEERSLIFAKRVRDYVNQLPKAVTSIEIGKQLIRAGASVGANYIEANESLGRNDFKMKIRISRKEAKEARYWLQLSEPNDRYLEEKKLLITESTELMNIFGAILNKAS